jgi:hypothetical protein
MSWARVIVLITDIFPYSVRFTAYRKDSIYLVRAGHGLLDRDPAKGDVSDASCANGCANRLGSARLGSAQQAGLHRATLRQEGNRDSHITRRARATKVVAFILRVALLSASEPRRRSKHAHHFGRVLYPLSNTIGTSLLILGLHVLLSYSLDQPDAQRSSAPAPSALLFQMAPAPCPCHLSV